MEMQADDCFRQASVVAAQALKAAGPGEGALDDPAAGQQPEPTFGRGQFEHELFDAVRRRVRDRLAAGVAGIDEGGLDVLTRHVLHHFRGSPPAPGLVR